MAAYLAAVAKFNTSTNHPPSGKIDAVITAYCMDPAFTEKRDSTRRQRRSILERIRVIHGNDPIEKLTPAHINRMLSGLPSPLVRRRFLEALRALTTFAIGRDLLKTDPTRDIETPKVKSEPYHPWMPEEIQQYKETHPLGSQPYLALMLLFHTAQRLGDVLEMGPGAKNPAGNGMIHVVEQEKTGAEVWIKIHPQLAEAIAASKCVGLTHWLVSALGTPFKKNSFGNKMREWCDQAGLPQCSAHGLRHAGLTWLAMNGCDVHELKARAGHTSLAQTQRYIEGVRKQDLAKTAAAKVAGVWI